MYLTRLCPDADRREVVRVLASPHRVHAALLGAFPSDGTTDHPDGRLLWRLDVAGRVPVLYLVSPLRPEHARLRSALGSDGTELQTKEYDGFLGRLAVGQIWAFRLQANPVHSVRSAGSDRGRRLAHVTADQQLDWFTRRTERHGFAVRAGSAGEPDLVLRARRQQSFRRGERRVTLSTAVFEGTLQVTSADELRTALSVGIGSAKGYGCGLLTLAAP